MVEMGLRQFSRISLVPSDKHLTSHNMFEQFLVVSGVCVCVCVVETNFSVQHWPKLKIDGKAQKWDAMSVRISARIK